MSINFLQRHDDPLARAGILPVGHQVAKDRLATEAQVRAWRDEEAAEALSEHVASVLANWSHRRNRPHRDCDCRSIRAAARPRSSGRVAQSV